MAFLPPLVSPAAESMTKPPLGFFTFPAASVCSVAWHLMHLDSRMGRIEVSKLTASSAVVVAAKAVAVTTEARIEWIFME